MGWVTHDYECACGWEGEELVPSEDRAISCPECESSLKPILSAPKLAMFSIASPEQKQNILKKRSEEHTKKEVRKEAEKFKYGAGIKRVMGEDRKIQTGYTGKSKK